MLAHGLRPAGVLRVVVIVEKKAEDVDLIINNVVLIAATCDYSYRSLSQDERKDYK